MSLLGFDAVGRHALGQLPTLGLTNTVLLTVTRAYAVAGNSAAFQALGASVTGLSAISGNTAIFSQMLSAAAGSYVTTGGAALFRRALAASPAGYAVNGLPVTTAMRMPSLAGASLVTGNA